VHLPQKSPDRLWGPSSLLLNGYNCSAAEVHRPGAKRTLTSTWCRVEECVNLYFFSPAMPSYHRQGQFYLCAQFNISKCSRVKNRCSPTLVFSCKLLFYQCFVHWWLTLREERRLKVFENRVLRRVFGPKRDEVTREWRKLHNELNDRHSLPNIVRVVK
jgi:hypothetical protein